MAVVFLEGGPPPIPKQMANAKLHRGPRRGVCRFVHCRTEGLQTTKSNSLLNLDFLASCNTA